MVKEIVFHLGDCKTGTTSIQSMLATGAWKSDLGDIVYPARVNHIPLAKTLTEPREMQFETKRFAKIRQAFDASTADYGVISAEHFEFVDPARLHAAIQRHLPAYTGRIRLLAYVRPHADRLVSTFAERTKKGMFHQPLAAMHEKLVKDRLLFYTPRFEKWRALFGEAFTVRPFVRDRLYQGDVVQDFLHHLLGSEAFDITRPTDHNESLSVEDIAMLRAIHRHIHQDTKTHKLQQQALGWYMSEFLAAIPDKGSTKPALHKALATRLTKTYAADAAALDAMFFEATPMSDALAAAPGKAVEQAQSFRAADHYDAGQLRQFKAWSQLLLRMIKADPGHFSWAMRPPAQRRPQGRSSAPHD